MSSEGPPIAAPLQCTDQLQPGGGWERVRQAPLLPHRRLTARQAGCLRQRSRQTGVPAPGAVGWSARSWRIAGRTPRTTTGNRSWRPWPCGSCTAPVPAAEGVANTKADWKRWGRAIGIPGPVPSSKASGAQIRRPFPPHQSSGQMATPLLLASRLDIPPSPCDCCPPTSATTACTASAKLLRNVRRLVIKTNIGCTIA